MKHFKCNRPLIGPDTMDYPQWDGQNWCLEEAFRAEYESDRVKWSITIGPGFVTDGGSIPKRLQGRWSPLGISLAAYLVHDGLYGTHLVDRAEADLIMCEIMEALGVGWASRNVQWAGVRAGGYFAWKGKTADTIELNRQLIEWRHVVKG